MIINRVLGEKEEFFFVGLVSVIMRFFLYLIYELVIVLLL